MSTKNKVHLLLFFTLFGFVLNSCTKEGAPGPKGENGTNGVAGINGIAGAVGATGIQGATGVPGTTGTPGATGTNGGGTTIKTTIINVASADWGYGTNNAFADKADADITSAIVTSGVVLVYMQGASQGVWIALPTTTAPAGGMPPLNIGFNYSTGQIRFNVTQNGPGAPTNLQAYSFKVVVME